MSKQSAGILLYKMDEALKVFLVHPGGSFWKIKMQVHGQFRRENLLMKKKLWMLQ
ncbi:MAG: hypothetical protein ABIQ07_09280 [Ginsengibacter sp.]